MLSCRSGNRYFFIWRISTLSSTSNTKTYINPLKIRLFKFHTIQEKMFLRNIQRTFLKFSNIFCILFLENKRHFPKCRGYDSSFALNLRFALQNAKRAISLEKCQTTMQKYNFAATWIYPSPFNRSLFLLFQKEKKKEIQNKKSEIKRNNNENRNTIIDESKRFIWSSFFCVLGGKKRAILRWGIMKFVKSLHVLLTLSICRQRTSNNLSLISSFKLTSEWIQNRGARGGINLMILIADAFLWIRQRWLPAAWLLLRNHYRRARWVHIRQRSVKRAHNW